MSATTTDFEIEGMSCHHCVMAVTNALKQVPGLTDVKVQVGKATVTTEGPAPRDAIGAAIAEEGYRVKGT